MFRNGFATVLFAVFFGAILAMPRPNEEAAEKLESGSEKARSGVQNIGEGVQNIAAGAKDTAVGAAEAVGE